MKSIEVFAQVLYVSRLAIGCDSSVVKAIVQVARRHNAAHGITGALMFDGERFCQLLEGPPDEVTPLMQRITEDPRHTDVRLLHSGVANGARVATRWRSGYCEPSSFEAFDAGDASGPGSAAALDAFRHLLPLADLD